MQITPVSNSLGANVTDVDVRTLDDAASAQLVDAWAEYGVLFIRDQDLTPDEHLTFARRFGDIDVNRFFTPVDGHPEIAQVLKEPDQQYNIGGGWHTDHSYDEAPALGSMLYAIEVPSHGGDTQFACMYQAWETLSAGMRETLEGMRACHSARSSTGRSSMSSAV